MRLDGTSSHQRSFILFHKCESGFRETSISDFAHKKRQADVSPATQPTAPPPPYFRKGIVLY